MKTYENNISPKSFHSRPPLQDLKPVEIAIEHMFCALVNNALNYLF